MTWSKNTSPLIGNDVVDLTLPNTRNKGDDQRFIDRVCAPVEQELLSQSDNATLTLWCLWSAKETAYKIVLKRDVNTLFAKKKFVVEAPISFNDSGLFQGTVQYEDMTMPVQWSRTEHYLHCTGGWPQDEIALSDVETSVLLEDDPKLNEVELTQNELASVRNDTSKSARQLAKHLMMERGFKNVEIIRQQMDGYMKAPRIWINGEQLKESTLSLSHHGQFVAAAVWVAD